MEKTDKDRRAVTVFVYNYELIFIYVLKKYIPQLISLEVLQ